MTEADTCRRFITPALVKAGWSSDTQIREQFAFTDGRISPQGRTGKRQAGKRADYLLDYQPGVPLAVVEAKANDIPATDGLQQAIDYAVILGIPFAFAANGREIIWRNRLTGEESRPAEFPSPGQLWNLFRKETDLGDRPAEVLLTPAYDDPSRRPRYYQVLAANRAIERLAGGEERVLLTLATGTGKSVIAFQICWRLWRANWNRRGISRRRPRILYLADRGVLVDQPMLQHFAPFGDAMIKVSPKTTLGREMYFATYQQLAEDERRPGLYREYPQDFFDLVLVDECHRGSARDESTWREILDWFTGAAKLGMTATPFREETRNTYEYFGDPVIEYSLAHRRRLPRPLPRPARGHRRRRRWLAARTRPARPLRRGDPGRRLRHHRLRARPLADRSDGSDGDMANRLLAVHQPARQDHRLLRRPGARPADA